MMTSLDEFEDYPDGYNRKMTDVRVEGVEVSILCSLFSDCVSRKPQHTTGSCTCISKTVFLLLQEAVPCWIYLLKRFPESLIEKKEHIDNYLPPIHTPNYSIE